MKTADVIIVGAGMAGLCAAVEAAEKGSRVLVFEKQAALGGSSLLSGCFMAFAETDFQKKRGIADSTESLMEDLRVVGQYQNDEKLIQAYGKNQLQTYNWLVEKGVVFKDCQAVSGHSAARGHTIIPSQAIHTLEQEALKHGAIIQVNSAVKRLIIEDGIVTGVIVQQQGEEVHYTASKGIIITSGGFSQSEELLHVFAPQLDQTIRLGGAGNTGDGIRLAATAGAWLSDFPYIKGTYGFHPSSSNDKKRQAHTFYKGGIIVNSDGQRFINESLSYKLLGDAALQQQQKTYQIFDEKVMQLGVKEDALYDFNLLYEEGLIVQAPTIQQLAEKVGLPAETLVATIGKYNNGIETNSDEFNRTTLTHTLGKPTALVEGPFYAMETVTAMLATYAGINVNEFSEVLNPFNEIIPNLFAAGEVIAGFHGAGYMTGSSLGKAAIFGRIAAQQALTTVEEVV